MASIAQAVTTSISGAANQSGGDPATVAPATLPVPTSEGGVSRPQDTVNLTETGGRHVPVVAQGAKLQPTFQVTYFPPTSVQGAASQPAAAVPVQTNNPTAPVASAAAAATNPGTVNASGAGITAYQASLLSAASQAKLQQLDEVLQQLGINPTQIIFAERIALLPLVNDPAAIQQYVQGLPTQTAVLSPATSQVLAPSLVNQQNVPTTAQTGATLSAAASGGAPSSASSGANSASGGSGTATLNPATTSLSLPAAGAARGSSDATGQKINISV
jgi:hypothetical protein